ncbi:MAG: hypothetical protein WDA03_04485 [Trueperaceae bacterium]|jgi:hypothetical protein
MNAKRRVTVIPLVGPFHTRFPLYNVVHVRELLKASEPDAVALATLPPGALEEPGWQHTSEIALPHAVVPWARQRGVRLEAVGSLAGSPGEPGEEGDEAEFVRYLGEFEAGRAHLRQVRAALGPVEELLKRGLDLGLVLTELVPALAAYDAARRAAYGEGPGTGWQAARAERVAERVAALEAPHAAVLVGVDDFGAVSSALSARLTLSELPTRQQLEGAAAVEARQRSLLDVAMHGQADDPAALLQQLRELGTPEARYHQANILLAHGHTAEALEVLTEVASGDFQVPYYLPGFVLARLGQLQDLAGERRAAQRAYRGVLALDFAPAEALEAARAGLEAPFELGAAARQ